MTEEEFKLFKGMLTQKHDKLGEEEEKNYHDYKNVSKDNLNTSYSIYSKKELPSD